MFFNEGRITRFEGDGWNFGLLMEEPFSVAVREVDADRARQEGLGSHGSFLELAWVSRPDEWAWSPSELGNPFVRLSMPHIFVNRASRLGRWVLDRVPMTAWAAQVDEAQWLGSIQDTMEELESRDWRLMLDPRF